MLKKGTLFFNVNRNPYKMCFYCFRTESGNFAKKYSNDTANNVSLKAISNNFVALPNTVFINNNSTSNLMGTDLSRKSGDSDRDESDIPLSELGLKIR